MKTKTHLEVGDVLYETYRGIPIDLYVVQRVTKTIAFAVCDTARRDSFKSVLHASFERESVNGIARGKGSKHIVRDYKLETPELKAEYQRLYLAGEIKGYDWSELDAPTLGKIAKLLKIDVTDIGASNDNERAIS